MWTIHSHSEAGRVTADMCRALLKQPAMLDTEAEQILEHLYLFASVITDAFVEQLGRSTGASAFENVPEAAIPSHLPTSLAA